MEQCSSRGKRIAFFGGSFDPPHNGHLAIAHAAVSALELDTVLFAPVGAQPLKPTGSTAAFEDRVAMTRLAIESEAHFEVSLLDRPKASSAPNFTLETLLQLKREIAGDGALFFLMGADSFLTLHRWHRAAEIPFVAPLIVASRPGQPLDDVRAALPPGLVMEPTSSLRHGSSFDAEGDLRSCGLRNGEGQTSTLYLLEGLHNDISASEIRRAIGIEAGGAGGDASEFEAGLLPCSVFEYIKAHQLYREA